MGLWIQKDDADKMDIERRAFIADLESLLQQEKNKCERLEKEVAELRLNLSVATPRFIENVK